MLVLQKMVNELILEVIQINMLALFQKQSKDIEKQLIDRNVYALPQTDVH